jgi:hypothetical protein
MSKVSTATLNGTTSKPPASPQSARRPISRRRHRIGRRPVPANETARQRFLRLGQARMTMAIHTIRLLGNLSHVGYQYEDGDVAAMRATLTEAIEEALSKFRQPVLKRETKFSFAS